MGALAGSRLCPGDSGRRRGRTAVRTARAAGRTALRRGDGEAAARALRSALGLWRGSPLDGLPTYPWVLADAARLDHLRLDLMMALYRSGRQADALETYQEAAQALADNHGLWSAYIPSGNDCGGSCMPNSSGAGGAGPAERVGAGQPPRTSGSSVGQSTEVIGRPSSRTANAELTARTTASALLSGANSTSHTASGNSPATARPSSIARRVLPTQVDR
jgi:hypothetical protein